jgi:hypothetical protein
VHHENPKILLDSFDRNITKNLNEVILWYTVFIRLTAQGVHALVYWR